MLHDGYWIAVKDGDDRARALFDRHYSRYHHTDGRKPRLFVGPGEKLVLLTEACDAVWVWRKFIDDSGQQGVNNAVFRSEGPYRASDLIREAEQWAWHRWPGARLYTYVSAAAVASPNPGYCFKCAGWRRCGVTQKRGYLIFEKYPPTQRPAPT